MSGLALACAALLAGFTGCRIDTDKNNKHENVNIATPFGGMSVKTDTSEIASDTGLTVYPGAAPVHEDGNDKGSADVNMNFGSFHLGVKASSFRSTDPLDKVEAFYRKDLARYGTVILCRNDRPVGEPTRTQDGLTCDKNKNSYADSSDKGGGDKGGGEDELRAGSRRHQHLVSLRHEGSGTKFGLVLLDLPVDFGNDSGDSEDKQ